MSEKKTSDSVNMSLWNSWNKPPASALKTIGAGRLKGKSDINPEWRFQALTEQLGPCGIGWKYEIVKLWADTIGQEVIAHAQINLLIKSPEITIVSATDTSITPRTFPGEWSAPIPGIGGSMLASLEAVKEYVDGQSMKTGEMKLFVNDEGYKMAVTDAISVAFKALGGAAEIYLGNWDGSKYVDRAAPPTAQPKAAQSTSAPQTKPTPAWEGGAPPIAPTSDGKLKGIVTGIHSEHKKNKAGKEYNIYTVEIDGVPYQTLFDKIGTSIKKSDEVEFQYEVTSYGNKKLTHFHHLHHAGGAPAQTTDDIHF